MISKVIKKSIYRRLCINSKDVKDRIVENEI